MIFDLTKSVKITCIVNTFMSLVFCHMLLTRALVSVTDQRVMGPHDVRCRVGERIWTEAPA